MLSEDLYRKQTLQLSVSYNVLSPIMIQCPGRDVRMLFSNREILYYPTLHISSWKKPAKWSSSKKGKNGITGQYLVMPPLLEQRCNGTSAGQGYLEVSWNCPCNSFLWAIGYSVTLQFSFPLLTLTMKHNQCPPLQASFWSTSTPTHHVTLRKIMHYCLR
jgi:hypothetical protein